MFHVILLFLTHSSNIDLGVGALFVLFYNLVRTILYFVK